MGLIHSWAKALTTSGAGARPVTPGIAIGPSGLSHFVAVSVVNNITTISLSDSKGNAYTLVSRVNNGTNMTTCLFRATLATALSATDTVTPNLSATSSRITVAGGTFDDVPDLADFAALTGVVDTNTDFATAAVATPGESPRALTVSAIGFTGAGSPALVSGNTIAAQIVTAVGTSDRGVALLYQYETTSTVNARAKLSASAVAALVGGSWDADITAPPPGAGLGSVRVGGGQKDITSGIVRVGGVSKAITGGGVVVGGVVKPFTG